MLHTDNWYTSVMVVTYLMSKGIEFIGTVLANRVGLPKRGVLTKKERGKPATKRGSIKYMKKIIVVDGRNTMKPLYFASWFDKKPVNLLSTRKTKLYAVHRKTKDARTRAYGIKTIQAPTIVWHYNHGMGGTDLCDQKLSYYKNSIRSRKWQGRVFIYFIQLAAMNAHVLMKNHFNLKRGQKYFRYKEFLQGVIEGLCNVRVRNDDDEDNSSDEDPKRKGAPCDDENEDLPYVTKYSRLGTELYKRQKSDHHPVFWSSHEIIGRRTVDDRPYCKVCGKKCTYSCEACSVGLCLSKSSSGDNNCWKLFHTD